MRLGFILTWLVSVFAFSAPVAAEPIDRRALVERHSPALSEVDPFAPLMIGNGELGFTADITGLQTFADLYSPRASLQTLAQWGWHSAPNTGGYAKSDGERNIDVPGRGLLPFAAAPNTAALDASPAQSWLRKNPHRLALGRIELAFGDGAERPSITELEDTRQRLDLWSGTLRSSFRYRGEPVRVETRVHPTRDMIVVEVLSPLLRAGELGVDVRYPGIAAEPDPDPADWNAPQAHVTDVLKNRRGHMIARRTVDSTVFYATIDAPRAEVTEIAPHHFRVRQRALPGTRTGRLVVFVGFEPDSPDPDVRGDYYQAVDDVADFWADYWGRGGAIDFAGTTDRRARELERRIVLSQYLMALNGAGGAPPAEQGLFSGADYGRFRTDALPLLTGHFSLWGRPDQLAPTLDWYVEQLPIAQAAAQRLGARGAWYPRESGPNGGETPSVSGPFLLWRQPHPIFLAELLYRSDPGPATLAQYGELVEQTAWFLTSWPVWVEESGRYELSPPILPAQEIQNPFTTSNPTFELEYFHWALGIAQAWRERRGLSRVPGWDHVLNNLAAPAPFEGRYAAVENDRGFWRIAESTECVRAAREAQCQNRGRPSFLMGYGFIGGQRIDPEAMRASLRAVERTWDLRQMSGEDFALAAMTAARLGEPEKALDWLFAGSPNNVWGAGGLTAQIRAAAVNDPGQGNVPTAAAHFPSNGALLLAAAMMAGGWEGSEGHAPGFPQSWKVKVENIQRLP